MKKITLIGILCIIIDQLIKFIVSSNMVLDSSMSVIKNFFSITYVRNYGAAFSILSGNTFFLILITISAIIAIYFLFIRGQKLTLFTQIIYGILFGGIIGNLIDRILNGYVIDYLDFKIFGYNFPVFNFADICIVISMIIIFILTFRGNINGKNNSR